MHIYDRFKMLMAAPCSEQHGLNKDVKVALTS